MSEKRAFIFAIWSRGWRPGCDAENLQEQAEQAWKDFNRLNPKRTVATKSGDNYFEQLPVDDKAFVKEIIGDWTLGAPQEIKDRTKLQRVAKVFIKLIEDKEDDKEQIRYAIKKQVARYESRQYQPGLQVWLGDLKFKEFDREEENSSQKKALLERCEIDLRGLVSLNKMNPSDDLQKQIDAKREEIRRLQS